MYKTTLLFIKIANVSVSQEMAALIIFNWSKAGLYLLAVFTTREDAKLHNIK